MAVNERSAAAGWAATVRREGLGQAVVALLSPLLRGQAMEAIRRAPRLPGPSGPSTGTAGQGDPCRRLLVIGDSTAAGVGAVSHVRALPGFLAEELTTRQGGTVVWTVRGKSGVTARRAITELMPPRSESFDVTVLTIGINDLLDRRQPRAWAGDLLALVDALRDEGGRTRLVLSGLPPVHRLPAIPQPLRFLAGHRARTMDRIVRRVAADRGAIYVPINSYPGAHRELFAPDGFHPSETGYRVWARALAQALHD